MKKLLFFIFLLLPLLVFAQSPQLIIPLGGSHKIPIKGLPAVWIENREVLRAEGIGNAVILKGTKGGTSLLRIGGDLYQVQVLHPTKTESFTELKNELSDIVGLKAHFSGGDLVISGRLYRLKDWLHLADFARSKTISFRLQAEIASDLQKEARLYFQELLEKSRLPPQTLIFSTDIEVRVNTNKETFKKYQQTLSPFGITVLGDEQSLDIAPTVKVEITVAEVKRNISLKYGLRWPSSYSAQIVKNGDVEQDALPFNLTALEAQGQGKVLASPNILCRSGKEAEFLAGGEFPIKIMNYKTNDVVWKRYGILLRIKPLADSSGRISLSIETEVTTLDTANKVDDIPGLLTNRVSSHFDLTRPQTIALSGLLKQEDGKSSEGLPFLARLPVLGALFSSKDFRENRSELVIFVRPTILKEEAAETSSLSHLGDTEGRL